MGKSLRSNRIQKNKSKLRSRVFGPVEEARTQRLSQRLAEIAASAVQQPEDKRKAKAKAAEDVVAEEEPAEAMREDDDDAARSKDDVEPAEGTPPCLRAAPAASRQRGHPFGSDVSLHWSGDSFLAVAGGHVDGEDDDGFFGAPGAAEDAALFALPFGDEARLDAWRAAASPSPSPPSPPV